MKSLFDFDAERSPRQLRLYGWQEDDVQFVVRRDGALVAHDMGLGKTLIALKTIERVRGPALVVLPKSMIGQWVKQLKLWTPHLTYSIREFDRSVDVNIVNYEFLLRKFQPFIIPWGIIVVDEAQRIKNRETKIARILRFLGSSRRLALTGTPIENSEDDLKSIMEFLNVPAEGNMIRRRTSDYLDLPAVVVERVESNLDSVAVKIYKEILSGLVHEVLGETFEVTNVLAKLTYLRQCCNGIPTLKGENRGTSPKCVEVVRVAMEIVAAGNKAIIFSEFRRMAEMVSENLRERGVRIAMLTGVTKDHEAEKESDWDVMICTKTGELGHDLQRANYVLNIDLPYNPARVMQRIGRAQRNGQTKSVVVVNFVVPGTVEERILEILYEKRQVWYREIDTGISMNRDLIRQIVQGET
ncbi:hypothetical protein LCGC14_0610130 [marine sediment metagenome]|uniref:Helicase ATP-binding domain-containing protein n=1 Tax=marine sediment metagenome TaxID=412755 RepID=A0A0F9R805_9ZZZZ